MLITLFVCLLIFLISTLSAFLVYRGVQSRSLAISVSSALVLLSVPLLALSVHIIFFTLKGGDSVSRSLDPGIHYEREVLFFNNKRALIHWVEIDLSKASLSVTEPKLDGDTYYYAAQKTSDALSSSGADLAINASFFYPFREKHLFDYYPHEGDSVYAAGLTVFNGAVYGSENEEWPSFVIREDGGAEITTVASSNIVSKESIKYGVSGKSYLTKNGQIPNDGELRAYPRAVVGMNKDKTRLWLVVVDGKQVNYSLGIDLPSLSRWLIEKGVHNSIELDGGGSATLAYKSRSGEVEVLNRPIHTHIPNRERPVANHLFVSINR